MLAPSLLAALGACGRGCARLAGPDAAAWRLLDVTAGALLAGVWQPDPNPNPNPTNPNPNPNQGR